MSILRLVGTAAVLATISASATKPALAQQVMSEPGYCAFYYPNANCQNKGPGNPYTDPRRFSQFYGGPDGSATPSVAVRKRAHRSPASPQ
ncbi:hypothetical protein J6524_03925 [Bradyrhizobium sp. WSM 1738]|uniref:hypothetical protein n=1 Tax=Bradyrhizobium hereditatis TaxID=2821405 RepID=UPI001CE2DC5E|nr:hypothetical protein [Bradyrhizobium hereditatis]MCA6114078.1 hypothetical protein [Bradyrhizobium hereditatis]